MKNLSIRTKLFLSTISILIITVIITSGINIAKFKPLYIEALLERARANANDLRQGIDQSLDYFPLDGFSDMTSFIRSRIGDKFSYAFIANKDKIILYHSDGKTKNIRLNPAFYNKLSFGKDSKKDILEVGNYYEIVVPIIHKFEILGTVHIGVDKNPHEQIIQKMIMQNIGILFIATVCSVILMYFLLTRNITTPITKLMRKIRYICSRYNLDLHSISKKGDELTAFANSFDAMTKELEEKTVSRDYVKSIIESMTDSLFVISSTGNIEMTNKATCKLLECEEDRLLGRAIDKIFQEDKVFHSKNIASLTKEGKIKNYEAKIKLNKGGVTPVLFSCSIMQDTLNKNTSIVCMVKDITDRKKAEELLRKAHDELEIRVKERTIELAQANKELQEDIIRRERTEKQLQESHNELAITLEGSIRALAAAVESRDPYTAGHQQRVSQLACAIAEELKMSKKEIRGVHLSGISHDIGKIAVPTKILLKKGKLTSIEMDIIKTHPRVGYDILKTIEFPWPIALIVLQHHERLNGSGYPQGLAEKDILIESKIIAVSDVVEAVASHRPYRSALGSDKALEVINEGKDKLFDPKVVDACVHLFTKKEFTFKFHEL